MNAIEKALSEALGHGKDLSSLAGKLRDKFKSGVSDLQAIYDDAESFVDAAVAKAQDGLAAFKAKVEEVEGEVKDAEGEVPVGRSGPDVLIHDAPLQLASAPSPETAVALPAPESDAPDAPSKAAEIAASVGAPEEHVALAVEAHDDAVTNGSTPEVAHAEAQAAAAQAGAEPEDAVRIADGVAGHGAVAEVKPVV